MALIKKKNSKIQDKRILRVPNCEPYDREKCRKRREGDVRVRRECQLLSLDTLSGSQTQQH